jgi:hypothetical protein
MGDILAGIGGGRWSTNVEQVRRLPYRSLEQGTIKKALPYWLPAGIFGHRSAAGLLKHSGHIAIDLDDLGEKGATKTIQVAVSDTHCKCAFRSASGKGVRLIFGCPPCSADTHKAVFNRVADHVRGKYRVEPDPSGSDVSRASFVSFDAGIWINPSALMLPHLADLAVRHTRTDPCVSFRGEGLDEGDRVTLAWGLGESRIPFVKRSDGTFETHVPLRNLGRDLVVTFRKHGLPLTFAEIDRAFSGWWAVSGRKGLKFRHQRENYFEELQTAVRCVEGWEPLNRIVQVWPRWTRHPDFPWSASSESRLIWAIQHHCAELKILRFFISARDAATITKTTFRNANQALHRLVNAGQLIRLDKPRYARHAQEYMLNSAS